MDRTVVAKQLVMLAKGILAAEPEGEEDVEDPKFNEKIQTLKTTLTKIRAKKRRQLRQFGIGLIRPNSTVEDLVDSLLKITTAG